MLSDLPKVTQKVGEWCFLLRLPGSRVCILNLCYVSIGDYHLSVRPVNYSPNSISSHLSLSPLFTSALELTHLHSFSCPF